MENVEPLLSPLNSVPVILFDVNQLILAFREFSLKLKISLYLEFMKRILVSFMNILSEAELTANYFNIKFNGMVVVCVANKNHTAATVKCHIFRSSSSKLIGWKM